MVSRRASEPQRIRITTAVALSACTAVMSILGSWYAQKADIATALAATARIEARLEKVEADQATIRSATSQSDKLIAVVSEKLSDVSARLGEVNDHLGRIEDRQVKIIMPAVTGNHHNQ